MLPISTSLLRLNEDISTDVKEVQLENILSIVVTFSVLDELKFNVVNPEQPQNIKYISVTFFVLKDFKSNDFNPEQL